MMAVGFSDIVDAVVSGERKGGGGGKDKGQEGLIRSAIEISVIYTAKFYTNVTNNITAPGCCRGGNCSREVPFCVM